MARQIAKNNNSTQMSVWRIQKYALIFADLTAIFVSSILFYQFFLDQYGIDYFKLRTALGMSVFAIVMVAFYGLNLQHYTIRRSFYDEFREVVYAHYYVGLIGLAILFMFDLSIGRFKHLYFLLVDVSLVLIFRFISRELLDYFGLWKKNCLMLGSADEILFARAALESQFSLGLKVDGILPIGLDDNQQKKIAIFGLNVFQDIEEAINKNKTSHVVVVLQNLKSSEINSDIEKVMKAGLSYSIIPDLAGASLLGMRTSHFFKYELLLFTPRDNLNRASYRAIKRLFDLTLSLIITVTISPIMLAIYLLLKLNGIKNPIYRHERIGLNGEKIQVLKFRTMYQNGDEILNEYLKNNEIARQQWYDQRKLSNDPRITPIGNYLRKTSLDELPQLFNVIWGDMSLVGPRPIVKEEMSQYAEGMHYYYQVRPGITGIWQISGRSLTTYQERIQLDKWYIKNWSIWYDIAILIRTIGVVIFKEGAY